MTALSFRFLISGLIAIGVAVALGQSLRLNRKQWVSTVIFGTCQNGLYLGLFFLAMQWLEAGLAAIIASTMPLLVAFFSWSVLKEKIGPLGIAGLLAGFIGVAVIMSTRISGGADSLGLIFTGVGVLALTLATLVVRGATSGGNLWTVVGFQMLVGSAVLAVPAMALETVAVDWSLKLIIAFAYTTLVPGLAATWVWFVLVSRIGATRAATFHFLNPFFGVAIAAALLGETLTSRDILGVVIITAGIFAVQYAKRAKNG